MYWARLHVKLHKLNAKIEQRQHYLDSHLSRTPLESSNDGSEGLMREHQTPKTDSTLLELTEQRNKLESQIEIHRKCSEEMSDYRGVNKFIHKMLGSH